MTRTVAFVSDSAEFAGAEQYMVTLVEALSSRWSFVAAVPEDASAETSRRLEAAGAMVSPVPRLSRRPRPAAVARLLAVARAADLVHVNATDQGDGLTGILAGRLAGRPTVVTLHNVIPGRGRVRERVSRGGLRRARRVIAVSEANAAWVREAGMAPVVVAHGVPRPRLVSDARRRLGVSPSAFVVGGIGRLHAQKAWELLCRAAVLLASRDTHFEFVVIGDGPERESLLCRPDCVDVQFVGYREAASSLLGAFDVFVLPSRYEAFGLVVAEAMLAGVPVVATRVGGLPEVLGDTGLLVPPERPDQLADAIARLASDRDLRTRLAARARSRADSLFTVERMAAATAAVYESVL